MADLTTLPVGSGEISGRGTTNKKIPAKPTKIITHTVAIKSSRGRIREDNSNHPNQYGSYNS